MENEQKQRLEILKCFLEEIATKENLDFLIETHSENINCFGALDDIDGWCEGRIEEIKGDIINKCKEKGLKLTKDDEDGIELLTRDFIWNRGIIWLNMSFVSENLKDKKLNAKECFNVLKKIEDSSKQLWREKDIIITNGIKSNYSDEQIKLLIEKGLSDLANKRINKKYSVTSLKGVVSDEEIWMLEEPKKITLLYTHEK